MPPPPFLIEKAGMKADWWRHRNSWEQQQHVQAEEQQTLFSEYFSQLNSQVNPWFHCSYSWVWYWLHLLKGVEHWNICDILWIEPLGSFILAQACVIPAVSVQAVNCWPLFSSFFSFFFWHERAAFQRSAFGRLTAGNDVVATIIISLLPSSASTPTST